MQVKEKSKLRWMPVPLSGNRDQRWVSPRRCAFRSAVVAPYPPATGRANPSHPIPGHQGGQARCDSFAMTRTDISYESSRTVLPPA